MIKKDYEMPDIPDLYAVATSQMLFADYEMTDCFKLVKTLWDIMKRAKHRFDRKDTLQISSSVCQFVQLKKDEANFPYVLYDFRNDGDRICVTQCRKHFSVFANVNDKYMIKEFFGNIELKPCFYGSFDSLRDCVRLWLDIVTRYCFQCNKDFIPF